MLSGVNIEATVRLTRAVKVPVFASGGLSTLDNVKALFAHESDGIAGAIAGRAIYEGTLDFKAAIKAARGETAA
ncbi:MAG: HisA/HisF-related TIM barrel protein, partial [Casimicrobiaceae bacterium]